MPRRARQKLLTKKNAGKGHFVKSAYFMDYSMTGRTNHKEVLEISARGCQAKRQGEFMVSLKAVLAIAHLITAGEIEGT